jgi:hypothetical protein
MSTSGIAVSSFNCEWRAPSSPDGRLIHERLRETRPAVVCITEGFEDSYPEVGHVIASANTLSCGQRRRVVLWSQNSWRRLQGTKWLEEIGFIAGQTRTRACELTIVGVCIPYRFSGRYNSPPDPIWSNHKRYLTELGGWLEDHGTKTIILGDFNQRIPPKWQPQSIYQLLAQSVLKRFDPATAGVLMPIAERSIDHICHSRDLVAWDARSISNIAPGGKQVSDHFGVTCRVAARAELAKITESAGT